MKNQIFLPVILLGILSIAISCTSEESTPEQKLLSGKLEASDAWLRPAAENSNSAGYVRIWNGTPLSDTLVSIRAEGVANSEIHESYNTDDGLSGMRPAGKLAVASGDSLILQPGGLHIMLMNTKRPFQKGDSLQLVLHFAKAGSLSVSAAIRN